MNSSEKCLAWVANNNFHFGQKVRVKHIFFFQNKKRNMLYCIIKTNMKSKNEIFLKLVIFFEKLREVKWPLLTSPLSISIHFYLSWPHLHLSLFTFIFLVHIKDIQLINEYLKIYCHLVGKSLLNTILSMQVLDNQLYKKIII